ncbi:hypothetical protein NKH18_31780 [Streptomyces sp. M10(2022)]
MAAYEERPDADSETQRADRNDAYQAHPDRSCDRGGRHLGHELVLPASAGTCAIRPHSHIHCRSAGRQPHRGQFGVQGRRARAELQYELIHHLSILDRAVRDDPRLADLAADEHLLADEGCTALGRAWQVRPVPVTEHAG